MNKYKKMYEDLLDKISYRIEYFEGLSKEQHKALEDNLQSDNEFTRTVIARTNIDLEISWKDKADTLKYVLNAHKNDIKYLH